MTNEQKEYFKGCIISNIAGFLIGFGVALLITGCSI